jgi:hypothetical protein
MQEGWYLLCRFLGKGRPQSVGTRGAFLEDGQARRIELVNDIAHRLVVAAELASDDGSAFATSRGEQNLAATQDKRIGRTQTSLDLVLLVWGEGSGKNRGSHAQKYTTFAITFGGTALALVDHVGAASGREWAT